MMKIKYMLLWNILMKKKARNMLKRLKAIMNLPSFRLRLKRKR